MSRDRELVLARLDRLLWVMESVATEGFSKSPAGRGSPNIDETKTKGDRVVLGWLERLTNKIDDEVEHYLNKIDEREERLNGPHNNEIRNAMRTKTATDRCPNCGTSLRSAGAF
jgi:uncharacterized protein with PIN domain